MRPKKHKVLVTDGNERATIAVIRSLGRKGIIVGVIGYKKNSLGFYSKYCKNRHVISPPTKNVNQFLKELLEILSKFDYDIILPITDTTNLIFSKNRRKIESMIEKVGGNELEVFMKSLDKMQTLKIAKKIDMSIPKTICPLTKEKLIDKIEKINYPCVIKPRFGSYIKGNETLSAGIKIAKSKKELIEKYEKISSKIPKPLIQEMLTGDERGIFLLIDKGRVIASFAHKRIRSFKPRGGASVLRKSTELDKTLKSHSIKLLREMNWNGPAMVEFKYNQRKKEYQLMEVNGRFWGSLALPIYAGIDFPYLYYKLLTGKNVTPVKTYKLEIKSRYLAGDIVNLFNTLKANPKKIKLRTKLKSIKNFLKSFEGKMKYDFFPKDDYRVGIMSIYFFFKNNMIKMWRK